MFFSDKHYFFLVGTLIFCSFTKKITGLFRIGFTAYSQQDYLEVILDFGMKHI